jgi:N-acyl-D-amino-acid deacylase
MPGRPGLGHCGALALTPIGRGGVVYDGSGAAGVLADVGIEGDRVVQVGQLPDAPGARVVLADGLAVVPGFVNVLSHAWGSLQRDGSGASDLLQGVTTEVFGEAFSLGPADERVAEMVVAFGLGEDARVAFDRLGEGLDHLVAGGVAPNVTSFVGGHNLRVMAAGFDDRPLTTSELDRLTNLVREEMQDGALGIGTALIYPPGNYADTDELVAVCRPVGEYDGTYISHMRSEGDRFLECLEELLEIGRRAECRTEVYHLKAAGRHNWHKMKPAIDLIQQARDHGQRVGANMYPYQAGGTALAASIPPRFHDGGQKKLLERLADPAIRREMAAEMRGPSEEFENLYFASGGSGILFMADLPDGTPARGRRLTEVATSLGIDDEVDALLEIVSRAPETGTAYFMIDEPNIELGLSQPWVSVGSDAAAHKAEPPFTDDETHPRTYGTFARFLGRYVRDRGVTTFADGIRRMTSLPADELGLVDRGRIAPGAYADVVVLDPDTVADEATFEDPHRYSRGVSHVLVTGELVVAAGAVLDARPGRRLRRGV